MKMQSLILKSVAIKNRMKAFSKEEDIWQRVMRFVLFVATVSRSIHNDQSARCDPLQIHNYKSLSLRGYRTGGISMLSSQVHLHTCYACAEYSIMNLKIYCQAHKMCFARVWFICPAKITLRSAIFPQSPMTRKLPILRHFRQGKIDSKLIAKSVMEIQVASCNLYIGGYRVRRDIWPPHFSTYPQLKKKEV